MQAVNDHIALSEQVIKTLLYFDIFSYPLTSHEVFTYLHVNSTTPADIKRCLDDLAEKQNLFRHGDLYSLQPDKTNVRRRIKGNREAAKWMTVARKQALFISRFPYVTAVMASGSLSKGYMDEHSDLDFFIVTAPHRLWIARTLLVLYKRIFLLNCHKKFCVNYFVDATHLEIEEKNLFTATEVATLVPLCNSKCYDMMIAANAWVRDFLPNFRKRPQEGTASMPRPLAKRFLEFLLHPVARPLDKLLMHISLRRWRRLYEHKMDKKDFDLAFKTLPYVSKNHPNNYQKKILDLYRRRLTEYRRPFRQTQP